MSDFREYLRANLFDGSEDGTVTMKVSRLLDEVTELVDEAVKNLEAERNRLDKEVDTLTTAAYAANEKNWALRKENDQLREEREALLDQDRTNELQREVDRLRAVIRTHLGCVPDHDCKYEGISDANQ
jgi:Skp family chaperone for outer membrane proteins